MRDLAKEGLPVTLSISLHAPNDEVRKQLLPVANAYAIEDVLSAAREYVEKTGRRVIFEYALVKGVNSDLRHADELATRLRCLRCHVNLIPLNAVRERDLHPPTRADVQNFLRRLEARRISATRAPRNGRGHRGPPAANCAAACWKTARSDNDGKQRSAP